MGEDDQEMNMQVVLLPPDPPEFFVEDDNMSLALRRSLSQSQDPAERGQDPDEYKIDESSSSTNLKSSFTRKSSNSNSTKSPPPTEDDGAGALVPFDHPPKKKHSTESLSKGMDDGQQQQQQNKPTKSPSKEDLPPGVDISIKKTQSKELRSSSTRRASKEDVKDSRALVPLDSRELTKANDHSDEQRVEENQLVIRAPPDKDMRFGFDHCYVTVPCKERLSVLFATLRRSSDRKVIVICSTFESAVFHAVLFRQLEMLHVYELHETMKDGGVAVAYDKFLYQYPGILFASEIALREFDIPPNVDYILQYEPPMNPTEYIYRMSNAKIYKTSCHKSLLFVTPDEMKFLEYYDYIPNKELEARRVSEFQKSVEKVVSRHSELNDVAWKAFRAFMIAYENHSHSDIYDHKTLDEDGIRKSFAQPHIPEYTAKYLTYDKASTPPTDDDNHKHGNSKKKEAPKKEDRWATKRGENVIQDEDDDGRPILPHQAPDKSKPSNWRSKETKTWRKGGQPWTTRDNKTWKHAHLKHGQKLDGDKK